MAWSRILGSLIPLSGLSLGAQAQRACNRQFPTGAMPFAYDRVIELAGSYDLSLIDTTGSAGISRRSGYDLILWPADSSRRYQYVRTPTLGREPVERFGPPPGGAVGES